MLEEVACESSAKEALSTDLGPVYKERGLP